MNKEIQSSKVWNFYWFNAFIAVGYLLITCIMFVMGQNPNPIGVGTLQWAAIIVHLILIVLFQAVAAKKFGRWKNLGYAIAGLLSVVVLYFILTPPIWNLLWKLRNH